MRKYRFLKSICLLFLAPGLIWSQSAPNISDFSKIADVLPPSPNAASLGKYGGIDLGLATGTANINIPVYEYASNNLKVPVSLSYSSNGFRVDELTGRVGTGWSLNTGGVITRTVYGGADEFSERLATPPDFPARSSALLVFMEALASSGGYGPQDAQPDMFSFNFNGYSGRFILDANMNPVLLSHSNLRIEKDFFSTTWNFKITAADGTQYFFGGDLAIEKTKKIQFGAGCGKNYTGFIPTAWYLQKIVHPNNDQIVFSYTYIGTQYETGINESIYQRDNSMAHHNCMAYQVNDPNLSNTLCVSILQTSGVLLQEINSTGGSKMKFIYADRLDGNEKLLTGIELYQPGQLTTKRLYSFNYVYGLAVNFKNSFSYGDASLNYHPFLTGFTEKSTDGLLTKNHSFAYNDINALPPRLSFAQDHYGFFNGQNNSTLIPTPLTLTWQQKLPQATANRNVDPAYCQKGLLSSITYPTGGRDSIIYESNQVYQQVATYPSQTSVNATATNLTYQGGTGTTNFSSLAVVTFSQEAAITGQCVSNSTTGGDPLHDQTTITLLDENNIVIYTIFLRPGDYFNEVLNLEANHIYTIKCNTNGEDVSGGASLYFMPGNITYQNMNVNTGGVRVAKVITSDAVTNVSNIKKYFYSKLTTPGISSGGAIYSPQYEKFLKVYIPCMEGELIDPNSLEGVYNCNVTEFDYYSMYSSTLNNIYIYPSSPISYSHVVESFGENYENGGIEHQYTVYEDRPAYSIAGDDLMLSVPLSSYAWKNARELIQYTFKKQGTNYIPVKKTFTNYKEDARVDQDIKAYMVNKKYSASCQETTPSDIEINAYDLLSYSNFRKWVYVDTVRTWTYDINGQNYLEQLNVSEYANVTHALPTKQITYASDNISSSATTAYPQDITLTGSEETARQALISKYMIGAPLQQQAYKGATQLFNLKTGYNVFANGLVLPQTQTVQKTGYSAEERTKFYEYNNYGKILEQSKTNDTRQSYIWSDLGTYPLAQVINASVATIAFASFESEGKGGWAYSGVPLADPSAPTGKNIYQPVSPVSKSGLTSGTYTVSYWSKNSDGASQTVNATTGTAGRNINGWTYYEHKIVNPVSGTITVSGSGKIDELRLYPEKAQMISYTYEPLIGITSQTDSNNRTIYYEYDALGRLKLIKDNDRSILKTLDYHYQ